MIRQLILRLTAILAFCLPATAAWAGGCAPVPAQGASLPPCCAGTDMHNGGRCTAPATQYQFTLASFGFEKTDGTEVRFGSPRLFDAASVGVGGAIGDYLSGIDLPPATYIALRPALGEQINLRADTLTADGRRCTGSLTTTIRQADGADWPACSIGEPAGGTGICRSGGLLKLRDDRLGAFTVGNGSGLTLNLQFDTNNGVICSFAPGTGGNSSLEFGSFSLNLGKN